MNDHLIFPVELRLRIDWSELDYFGHVNNVTFFKYMQASRVNYWEAIGLYQSYGETKVGPMLVSVKCDFRKPLFYPGNIVVSASVEMIKTTSFGMVHRIINEHGEVCAEGHDVMVMFDFGRNEKVAIPDVYREKIQALEGRKF